MKNKRVMRSAALFLTLVLVGCLLLCSCGDTGSDSECRHTDMNCDGECELCGGKTEIRHEDSDGDKKCDRCGGDMMTGEISAKKSASVSEGVTLYPTHGIGWSGETYRGSRISYRITVKNEGESATTAEIQTTLPRYTKYLSGAERTDGDRLLWTLALGAGEEKSVEYTLELTAGREASGEVISGGGTTVNGCEISSCDLYIGSTLNEIDRKYVDLAVRVLAPSSFGGIDLAARIYTHAFTQGGAVSELIPGDPLDAIDAVIYGYGGYERLFSSVAPGLWGGRLLGGGKAYLCGSARDDIGIGDLISGDLLIVKSSEECKLYIANNGILTDITDRAAEVDTERVLASLGTSDAFITVRPSLNMTAFTPSDPDEEAPELSDAQRAIIAAAESYLYRGEALQYEDVHFGLSSTSGEYRWAYGEKLPEEYTSDEWGYVNCAVFTYDVYLAALGFRLPGNMYTTERLTENSAIYGMRVFSLERSRSEVYSPEEQLEVERQFMETLEVGDIMVRRHKNATTGKTTGHAMLYVGNGKFIHSSGASYTAPGGVGKEVYEATIRGHRVHDYLFSGKTSMFNDEDNVITIVRPLNGFSGEIPENSRNRMEGMKGIKAEKLSSHPSSVSVSPGGEITYTYVITNLGDEPRTITVSDRAPLGTSYIAGADEVCDGVLYFKLTLNGGEVGSVSYTVRVDEDAKDGMLIDGVDGRVEGVLHRTAATRVKKTLDKSEGDAILRALAQLRNEGTELTGLELINEIYKRALGVADIFRDGTVSSVLRDGEESVFAESEKVNNKKSLSKLRYDESYYSSMLVDHLYGGMRFDSSDKLHDRTRLLREHNLVAGDVLLARTSSSEYVYVWGGDGVLYNLTSGISEVADFGQLAERLLYYGRDFAVLRPSYILEA
ncbi:MAG: DUF11 domain-containing protein [Clostridia bacterium]|nr:DUF11 domain-containing protein [Clostridia bacterium]